MLRSVKYGLYGAVVAGLVGGTVAFTTVDKTVRLVVDGRERTVHTTASDVSGVLSDAGYHVGAHDLLAPSAPSQIDDHATIVLERGRLLHLQVNGAGKDVWTTAPTVSVALSQLGYSTADFASVSRSRRLPLGATDIAVRTPTAVFVVHDGVRTRVSSTAATVADLLAQLSVTLGRYDQVSVPTSTALGDVRRIVVTRVVQKIQTRTRPIPFGSTTVHDPRMTSGTTKTVARGKPGTMQQQWAAVYVDGTLIGRTRLPDVVVTEPSDTVTRIGTKQLAPNTPPAATPSPGTAQAIAQQMMLKDYGWGNDQFSCLVEMWNHESGWRVNAYNPAGPAYGIPQALPGSKMASAGPDWETNAATQIRWGLRYIHDRYGTPCGAWTIWQTQSWY